jgi:YbgC/YbaW family acyl-CoA thioester hydrolase
VYFEVARVAYLEAHAGGYQAVRDSGVEALTTEVFVRYHEAAYFDERLTVWTRCADLRGARFSYEYRIVRDGGLVVDGHTRHATVDRTTYRPTRVPEWLATAVAKAESAPAT